MRAAGRLGGLAGRGRPKTCADPKEASLRGKRAIAIRWARVRAAKLAAEGGGG